VREGRKPRRRAAAEPDVAAAGPAVEGESEVEGAPSTAAAEVESPTVAPGSTSLMVIPDSAEPRHQLSFDSLDIGAADEPDEGDEPDEPADLLVSVSTEALAGVENIDDETGDAYDGAASAADGSDDYDNVGEWAYPEVAAGDATYVSRPEIETDQGEDLEDAEPVVTADLHARRPAYGPEEALPLDRSGLQIRLARIHLRTGSLFMARAELESLAGRQQLDTAAHLDLAEARWRTGDLQGAGEAATAYLEAGGDEALGFVISAEAFALAGRHEEAGRQVGMAMERLASEHDPVFAGMPRHASWPAGAWTSDGPEAAKAETVAVEAIATQVETEAGTVAAEPAGAAASSPEPQVEPAAEGHAPAAGPTSAEPTGDAPAAEPIAEPAAAPRGETEPAGALQVGPRAASEVAPEESGAGAEVAAGRSFLESGDPMMAALHFAVAIRLAPVSAEAVLEAIGDRGDLPLQLVRGDALRLLGLEVDAGNTYLSVASALGAAKSPAPGPDPEVDLESVQQETAVEPVAEPAPESAAIAREPEPTRDPAPEPQSTPVAPPAAEEPRPLHWE
jgi:hypothetical protein